MSTPSSPSAKPPLTKRRLMIIGGVVGVLVLLVAIGKLGSGSDTSTTTASTVTVTVASPPTTSTVTVTAAAPPAPLLEPPSIAPAPPIDVPSVEAELPPPVVPAAPQIPSSAYYRSCADARAAGAAPLRRGEPGYSSDLDRDGDGIACDS